MKAIEMLRKTTAYEAAGRPFFARGTQVVSEAGWGSNSIIIIAEAKSLLYQWGSLSPEDAALLIAAALNGEDVPDEARLCQVLVPRSARNG